MFVSEATRAAYLRRAKCPKSERQYSGRSSSFLARLAFFTCSLRLFKRRDLLYFLLCLRLFPILEEFLAVQDCPLNDEAQSAWWQPTGE